MKGKFEFLIKNLRDFCLLLTERRERKKKKEKNIAKVCLSHECLTCGAEKIDKTFVIEQLNIHTRHL